MCIKKWFRKEKIEKIPKFGSLAKVGDPRTIQLQQLLNTTNLPPLPSTYILDAVESKRVPTPMFQNDIHNCCVIAARGHVTFVFEDFEQGITIPIQEYEVMNEYYKQTGGADNGLYMLNSIKLWQSQGWIAGGKNYKIYAFAQVNHKDHNQVCHAIMKLKGLYVGLNMSMSCFAQVQAGNPWTYAPRDSIWGNHCVYIIGFDSVGPICITWGRVHHMTWEFWDNMCTECYAIIDDKNSWMIEESPLNIEELEKQLDAIKTIPSDTLTSVKVTVVDKFMVPVGDCQVGVYKNEVIPQTYAFTTIRNPNAPSYFVVDYGFALFNGLKLGEEYQFTAQYQATDKKALYPKTVTKVLSKTDGTTTNFTIQLPFDYIKSKEQGTLIL